ncbi:MAG: hypothetical protein FJ087_01350 [Deltaproteobacteria bacterium]|nr:hypothetical protein [Deltaproteobacteria bacterium]
MEPLAPGDAESRDVLDVFCYLACMGPDAFERPRAADLLGLVTPDKAKTIASLVDTDSRQAASRRVGGLLADRLCARGAGSGRAVGAVLPSLLDADVEAGFSVLKALAAAAPPSVARDLSDMLLALTVAEAGAACRSLGADSGSAGQAAGPVARLRYLVSVLAALDLDAPGRARLFLALSQTLENAEILRAVVLTAIFPARSDEATAVLTEGNEDAVRAVLEGAASRPRGKAEFYEACKAVMSLGVRRGLPALARVYRLLSARAGAGNLRAMSSMVRAAVLLALEEAAASRRGLASQLPEGAEPWTLHLLALVAPGLKEPGRSAVCEFLMDEAAARLRSCAVDDGDADAFVQAVVAAAVLHADPTSMGAKARRMVMDAAAALHVRAQAWGAGAATVAGAATTDDSARVFRKVVGAIASEFRRRDALASSLAPVMPFVDGFAPGRPPVTGTGLEQAWAPSPMSVPSPAP